MHLQEKDDEGRPTGAAYTVLNTHCQLVLYIEDAVGDERSAMPHTTCPKADASVSGML
jgi:hypothetical protein